jgi:hypothetical protein
MRRRTLALPVAAAVLALGAAASAAAPLQSMTTVTLDDLLPTRILEIEAGTEVVFADPRFLSVEVVPDDGAPEARRIASGFTALFRRAGTFRVVCIVSGYERAERVPGEVIVRPRPGGATLLDFRAARPGVTEQEFELAQAECLRDPRAAGSVALFRMCMQARGIIPF